MGARVYGVGARVYGAGARVYGVGARVYGSLVIIVSAPVQRIGFWGFSDLVRTFGSGLGDCWNGRLGLGLDNWCGDKNDSSLGVPQNEQDPLNIKFYDLYGQTFI